MAHEKVAGTPDTQFRSWRKKMESCVRECTNSTELKNWRMTIATHTPTIRKKDKGNVKH